MSGFAVLAGPDAAPADRDAVDAIAGVLGRRGPDACTTWSVDDAALIFTLFRTSDEARDEHPPAAPADRFQLVGDARIDARDELVARLRAAGRAATAAMPDLLLVWHAWHAWGDASPQHLRGDFTFAVWDRSERRLFGARDQFGVRPFYYAALPGGLVAANMLGAIRRHPAVADELDDEALVDQLVFGQAENPAGTAFKAIRRLPGGHTLSWRAGRLTLRRYWSGLSDRPVRFRRDGEYVDRYRELLTRAVADRMRTSPIAVAMTGGMDSSSIAATAAGLLRARGAIQGLDAHTIVYDHLIPDREREFAGAVARHIGVPLHCFAADGYPIYARVDDPALQSPEPQDDPFRAMLTDFYRGVAARARVVLMGLDGDTFLNEIASDYLLARLRRREFGEYARAVAGWMRTRRSLPPHRIRSTVRRLTGRGPRPEVETVVPRWMNGDMIARFDIRSRWEARRRAIHRPVDGWPLRVRAESVLASPLWASMFDTHDAEWLGVALEARFPLADLELAEFLMNIPAVPWCVDKYIARQALAGQLPAEVLGRPKTPLAGDPVRARIEQGDRLPWAGAFRSHPQLGRFVDVRILDEICNQTRPGISPTVDTRALMLNEWLWYHLPRS